MPVFDAFIIGMPAQPNSPSIHDGGKIDRPVDWLVRLDAQCIELAEARFQSLFVNRERGPDVAEFVLVVSLSDGLGQVINPFDLLSLNRDRLVQFYDVGHDSLDQRQRFGSASGREMNLASG